MSDLDPSAALGELAACKEPFLIGVRHHSPSLAAAMHKILDAAAPKTLFVELPADLSEWLPWLAHPALEAPVALAGVGKNGEELGFYPFADFSPELAAIRWARNRDCDVVAFDLPLSYREPRSARPSRGAAPRIHDGLQALVHARDSHGVWQKLVEARAPGSTSEELRRAALLYGWALRAEEHGGGGVTEHDLQRESHMREQLAKRSGPCAVVVGAFHAAALLPTPRFFSEPPPPTPGPAPTTSLVRYSFELLDDRSGYPAGIRDPRWQQQCFAAAGSAEAQDAAAARAIADVCAKIRSHGHVAGVPDASEALRVARDLAGLRGLATPGREELLEAIATSLAQGQPLGRGRIIAKALDEVFVGRKRGQLAADTPRSGLLPHVEALLADLGLPGPEALSAPPKRFRLDPLRSDLDRRRHIALRRLAACGVAYGTEVLSSGPGATETLTRIWDLQWQPATEAMLELAMGVTLASAAFGALRARARDLGEDGLSCANRLRLLEDSAECGIAALISERFAELGGSFLEEATLQELLAAQELSARLAAGHIAGAGSTPEDVSTLRFAEAGVRSLEGLAGSEVLEDTRAALALTNLHLTCDLGTERLRHVLRSTAREGSALMQGAALGILGLVGAHPITNVGEELGAWVFAPPASESLSGRLRGLLSVAGPLFEASPQLRCGLVAQVETMSDDDFVARLPSLRHGFEALSPAARGRLLDVVAEALDEKNSEALVSLAQSPELLALYAAADRAGAAAVAWSGEASGGQRAPAVPGKAPVEAPRHDHAIGPIDRWRLLLGREREKLANSHQRYALALDDLYGSGRGEGSREGVGQGGGQEPRFPTVRVWQEELEALFDGAVCERVVGRAIESGQSAALLEGNLESLSPSVELLSQVLSLKGGLAESKLGQLRALVARIADHLVAELAIRVQPALRGLAMPRPTRRPGGPLDLPRTIAANLTRAQRAEDGSVRIVPSDLIFSSRGKKSMDWNIVLVVDVSGSMEPSVVYSAMMAAILSRVPWVQVHFIAFSTEIVDLTGHVGDPLGLLLEVKVGGGTHIAKALRYARGLAKVPSRTIVLCLSDFEEGFPLAGLLGAVRDLVSSGITPLGLASLDDKGAPRYSKAIAEAVVGAGMPVAALSPLELARWIGEQLRG